MTREVPGGFSRSNELPSPFTLYAVEAYNHPPYPTGYVRQDMSVQGFTVLLRPNNLSVKVMKDLTIFRLDPIF